MHPCAARAEHLHVMQQRGNQVWLCVAALQETRVTAGQSPSDQPSSVHQEVECCCAAPHEGSLLSSGTILGRLPALLQMSTGVSYNLKPSMHHVGTRHTPVTGLWKENRGRKKKKKGKQLFS